MKISKEEMKRQRVARESLAKLFEFLGGEKFMIYNCFDKDGNFGGTVEAETPEEAMKKAPIGTTDVEPRENTNGKEDR